MNCSPLWRIQKKTKKPLPLEVENFSAFVKGSLLNQVADIHDDVGTTTVDTKRGPKLQAHRRVTANSYKRLHQDFQKLYNSLQVIRKLHQPQAILYLSDN